MNSKGQKFKKPWMVVTLMEKNYLKGQCGHDHSHGQTRGRDGTKTGFYIANLAHCLIQGILQGELGDGVCNHDDSWLSEEGKCSLGAGDSIMCLRRCSFTLDSRTFDLRCNEQCHGSYEHDGPHLCNRHQPPLPEDVIPSIAKFSTQRHLENNQQPFSLRCPDCARGGMIDRPQKMVECGSLS